MHSSTRSFYCLAFKLQIRTCWTDTIKSNTIESANAIFYDRETNVRRTVKATLQCRQLPRAASTQLRGVALSLASKCKYAFFIPTANIFRLRSIIEGFDVMVCILCLGGKAPVMLNECQLN